jgi:predicted class III extradiol MEMO1 family dioxygenase
VHDLRRTAVSGQFYPGIPKYLKKELKRCFTNITGGVRDVTGSVVPHAGYPYSGTTAAHVYTTLPEADTYVLLGPNHTGLGSVVAVSRETWNTPLGDVPANKELVKQLLGGIIDLDESAHQYEHSIEVQLPFLQYRFSHEFSIVPICMGLQDQETATPVLELDVDRFYQRLAERNASVCGYGPISAMLTASKALGASKGTLLNYTTSGDVTGDTSAVVGYAGIIIE